LTGRARILDGGSTQEEEEKWGEGDARRQKGDGNDERLRRDERDDAMMLRDGGDPG
jgi:hypothetical protein